MDRPRRGERRLPDRGRIALFHREDVIAKRARVVKRVVRHLAVRRRAEIAHRREAEDDMAKLDHISGAGDHQVAELRDVFGPVGEDQRLLVVAEVPLQRMSGMFARKPRGTTIAREPCRDRAGRAARPNRAGGPKISTSGTARPRRRARAPDSEARRQCRYIRCRGSNALARQDSPSIVRRQRPVLAAAFRLLAHAGAGALPHACGSRGRASGRAPPGWWSRHRRPPRRLSPVA